VTTDDPADVKTTTADAHLYYDSVSGNDANDGSVGFPVQTPPRLFALIAKSVKHHLNVHCSGDFNPVWNLAFLRDVFDGKTIIFNGEDGQTVVADDTGSPWVSDTNGAGIIGLSTLVWTKNQYTGYMVQFTSGTLINKLYTIMGNTAAGVLNGPWPDPGAGANFHIVQPTTKLTVNGTVPFDFTENANGGVWSIGGNGTFWLQNFTCEGNIPVNFSGGRNGKADVYMAACVVDKSAFGGAIWKTGWVFMSGAHGFSNAPRDPAVFGGGTGQADNHAGVGVVGGDGSNFLFGNLFEWCQGFTDNLASFSQEFIMNACTSGLRIREGSHAMVLKAADSKTSQVVQSFNCSFGGYIPFGAGSPVMASVLNIGGTLIFGDDVEFKESPYGIQNIRGSDTRLEGVGTGVTFTGITRFGWYVRDFSNLLFEPGAVLTGSPTLGDGTFDDAIPVPGGNAGILAGTDRSNAITMGQARVQANLAPL
jgi:hypothetical protein